MCLILFFSFCSVGFIHIDELIDRHERKQMDKVGNNGTSKETKERAMKILMNTNTTNNNNRHKNIQAAHLRFNKTYASLIHESYIIIGQRLFH